MSQERARWILVTALGATGALALLLAPNPTALMIGAGLVCVAALVAIGGPSA